MSNGSSNIPIELIANSVVVFMVRGLFSALQFPYAYFPSRKVTGIHLFAPMWEAVCRLERNGFKVSAAMRGA